MNRAPRIGLLLINLGTPSSPEVPDVRRYLRQLLMDERVLDMPAWLRFLLVQLAIVPRRSRRSAASYQKIWTDRGSPLLVHGQDLRDLVEAQLGDRVAVELAMRMGPPSIRSALDRLETRGIGRLVLFPLYAQSSSASTESSVEAVQAELARRASHAVSFQSRPGRTPWIAPFTDEVLAEQARRGRRRVVVISGFVADCLETLEELRIRGREIWLRNGGKAFELVPAPNASAAWAKAVVEIAGERLLGADRGS